MALDHGHEAETVLTKQVGQSDPGSSGTLSWNSTIPGKAVRIAFAMHGLVGKSGVRRGAPEIRTVA